MINHREHACILIAKRLDRELEVSTRLETVFVESDRARHILADQKDCCSNICFLLCQLFAAIKHACMYLIKIKQNDTANLTGYIDRNVLTIRYPAESKYLKGDAVMIIDK